MTQQNRGKLPDTSWWNDNDNGLRTGITKIGTGPTVIGPGTGTTSSWTSFFEAGGRRPGGYRRTPGTDPTSYGNEKIRKTDEPVKEKFPWIAACFVSSLSGVFVGAYAYGATGASDKEFDAYLAGGGPLGFGLCTAAYYKYG